MPLLSVVVAVHGVQGYLRECLDSILDQSFSDIEIIAVDDRSPDHCPAILDEYAAREPRVRVLHLSENVGLGHARNAGLDRATGEYVWFVDSDDWLAAGCLRAIAASLRANKPDVLIVDHTRVSWLGRHWGSDGHPLLTSMADAGGCVSLADEPQLLRLFTVAWNKVVRREFLVASRLRFDTGWYEDLPWTFPILVAADRIAGVGRVCYHYRKRRQEAITQTTSERHFEVFDQWTRVFDQLDGLGSRAVPFRAAMFDRMVWHLLVVQAAAGRLPAGTRRDFFHRMSEHYRRYAPAPGAARAAEVEPVSRLDRVRRRLIATDRYRTFRVLRAVRLILEYAASIVHRGATAAAAAGRRLGAWGRDVIGRIWYSLQRRRPLDDRLAVYASYWNRGVSCNPAAIDAAARRLAPSVRPVWLVDADRTAEVPPGTAFAVTGSFAYYRVLARAKWLINNVNFPDFVIKRPGSVHVQTHHGTPIKVMGLDQAKFPVGAKGMNLRQLMTRSDRWDYSLSSNAHTTEVWARSYPCQYENLKYGYPRNDRLALATPEDAAAARRDLGVDDSLVVLYAPTHREYLPGYQPLLAIEEFADSLGPDAVVLARAHYFYKGGIGVSHPQVRDVSAYPVIEDLMLAADVLVTDYSSVMFDYAVLDRPIAVYAPDWEAYQRTRGVTFDLLAEAPGFVARTQSDLQAAFASGEVFDDAATKAREKFRSKFCYLDDGHAADRVVRRVFADALE